MGSGYREFHRRSIEERDTFWSEQANLIDWHRPFEQVLDYSNPPFAKWFVGGETNLCHNAVDRHLAERADPDADDVDVAAIGMRLDHTRDRFAERKLMHRWSPASNPSPTGPEG